MKYFRFASLHQSFISKKERVQQNGREPILLRINYSRPRGGTTSRVRDCRTEQKKEKGVTKKDANRELQMEEKDLLDIDTESKRREQAKVRKV